MAGRVSATGRQLEDFFFKEAKPPLPQRAGYAARSAYKLQEIQNKHRVIRPGSRILDLGCHPGAWMQVACQSLGPLNKGGSILGVDIQETAVPIKHCDARVKVVQADVTQLSLDFWRSVAPEGFDTVLSDMCHSTQGSVSADAARSIDLAACALGIATGPVHLDEDGKEEELAEQRDVGLLNRGGCIVLKLLQGPGTLEFAAVLKRRFKKMAWQRPKATRKESKEVFLVGMERK